MSRPKMAEAHRAQMRARILDKAYAILIEKGPENISSRAVAQNLELTHMGLFTYFPNQAAILAALTDREQAKFFDRLQLFVKHAENEEISRVVGDALHFFQNFASENPNLFRLIWIEKEANSPPRWMQSTIDLLAALIAHGIENGVFRRNDVQLAATTVIGLVNMPFVLSSTGKINSPELLTKMADEALTAAMQLLQGSQDQRAIQVTKKHLTPWFERNWATADLPAAVLLVLLSPIYIQCMGWMYLVIYLQIPFMLFQQYAQQTGEKSKNDTISLIKQAGIWLTPVFLLSLAFYIWLPAGLIPIYLGFFNGIFSLANAVRMRTFTPGFRIAALLQLAFSAASTIIFTVLGNMRWYDHFLGMLIAWLLFTILSSHSSLKSGINIK